MNEDQKRRHCEAAKKWIRNNKERHCEASRKWVRNNKEKALEVSRRWYKRNKGRLNTQRRKIAQDWNELKQSLGCYVCGSKRFLGFHHKDPQAKSFNMNLGGLRCRSAETQWAEVRKCVLLCTQCHHDVHVVMKAGLPVIFKEF